MDEREQKPEEKKGGATFRGWKEPSEGGESEIVLMPFGSTEALLASDEDDED
jgi:hypothetical protein